MIGTYFTVLMLRVERPSHALPLTRCEARRKARVRLGCHGSAGALPMRLLA
jgi:hypothetical protein